VDTGYSRGILRYLTHDREGADASRASSLRHGLDLPVFEMIAERLSEGAAPHGDKDFSATYLTSEPDRAA
jgi:hypothetical protein